MRLLISQHTSNPQHVQIDPTVIILGRIRAVEHSRLAGLQVADAVASGLHFAVKVNRYGETEAGYLRHIASTMFKYRGVLNGYGLKLWPGDIVELKEKAPEISNLEGL